MRENHKTRLARLIAEAEQHRTFTVEEASVLVREILADESTTRKIPLAALRAFLRDEEGEGETDVVEEGEQEDRGQSQSY